MPGPASPARKNRWQVAKEKERAKSPRVKLPPADYRPDSNSPVWDLPSLLTDVEKAWWDKYGGKGEEFDLHLKARGSHDGAANWLRRKFINKWWADFYPELDIPEIDKIYYCARMGISNQIYSYLHNPLRDQKGGSPGAKSGAVQTASRARKTLKVKKRVIAHDHWRRSNLGVYKRAVDKYSNKFSKPTLAKERDISYKTFRSELSESEQAEWRKRAEEAVESTREAMKITDPQERANFIKQYIRELCEMLEDLEDVVGVKICAMILHEMPEGKYKISRELSKGIKGFGKTLALASAMGAFQKWYQDTAGKPVDNPIPLPTVYPDYTNDGYPLLPDITGIALDPARHLLRVYVNALFRFQGSIGKVLWTEIKANLDYWLDTDKLPEGFVWDDPSRLPLHIVLLWLDFFLRCQSGEIPLENRFQFRRTPAGNKPISASESQETSRKKGTYKGKETTMLVFDRPVMKCQHPEGMDYTADCLLYAEFINTGLFEPESDPEPFDAPDSWLSLPIPGPNVPDSVLSETEKQSITAVVELLPTPQRELALGLLDAAMEHQRHLPASDKLGVYGGEDAPPKLIPPSPDSDSWLTSMWAPPDYYLPLSEASLDGTVSYFESWQRRQFATLQHEPSGTLYGGKTGVIRVVRPLIQLLCNFAAVLKHFKPPEDPPKEYDPTRLPTNDWSRLQEWIQSWTAAIEASTAILRQTSSERREGLAALQSLTDDDEPAPRDPTPGPSSSRTHDPVPTGLSAHPDPDELAQPSTKPKKPKSKPKPKSKLRSKRPRVLKSAAANDNGKGKERARDSSDEEESVFAPESEDGQNSREIDFEALDRTSQDGMSDEELVSNFGPEPDDVFPPNDPIGLHAKYGYSPNLPLDSIEGVGSITLSAYARSNYSPINDVFGKSIGLPEVVPSRITTPESLAQHLVAFQIEAKRVKAQYLKFGRANPKFPKSLGQQCLVASKGWTPVRFQPLVQWLLAVQAIWMRAHAIAPLALAQNTAMGYVVREGFQLHTIAETILESAEFSDPAVPRSYIEDLVRQSKILSVELQWAMACLVDWNILSTETFKKLDGSFLRNWPNTVGDLAALCQNTLDWRDDTDRVKKKLYKQLLKLWQGQLPGSTPADAESDEIIGFSYTFGTPYGPDIEPHGLRDSLASLQNAPDASELRSRKVEKFTTPDKNPLATTPAASPAKSSTSLPRPRMRPRRSLTPEPGTSQVPTGGAQSTQSTTQSTTETASPGKSATSRAPRSPTPELTTTEVPTGEGEGGDDASALGIKRKRDPSSSKAATKTSTRIRDQATRKAQEGTQAQVKTQPPNGTEAPPPHTTRSQVKAQNASTAVENAKPAGRFTRSKNK